jgi:hypothetical protein
MNILVFPRHLGYDGDRDRFGGETLIEPAALFRRNIPKLKDFFRFQQMLKRCM